jgi:hypothetical protein
MPSSLIEPGYGGGRDLPVHATVEDPQADLGSGLLLRIQAAMLGVRRGQILRVSSPVAGLEHALRSFEDASGHGLLASVDDPARPGWRHHYLRKGRARTDWTGPGASPSTPATKAAPAASVDALLPTRLWIYANYDCNLACDYCCVVAGPRVDPRRVDGARIVGLAGEAADRGFERVFLTGGEPTLRPDLPALIEGVAARIPVTILSNAMLLRGPRWDRLRPVLTGGLPVTFQVSLDSATPALHDRHRGPGAHGRALEGIATLRAAGVPVRLAASLAEADLDELPRLHHLADGLGIDPADRIFRPIALRGAAAAGEPIRPADVAPELTYDAAGWLWHPISNDADMRLPAAVDASLADALGAVRDRLVDLVAGRAARLDRFVCG